MVYTTTSATTPIAPSSKANVDAQPSLDTRIKAALEHARRLTAMYGTGTIEVAIAWETVEELQKAASQQKAPAQTSLERYCAEYPEAPECRIYED